MAIGSVEPLRKLHTRWGERVTLVDVIVHQEHPGPNAPPYRSFAQKLRDAEAYQREQRIPWAVLVDDLEGTLHQVYGTLANPAYLIDRDGRVAYYDMWTHAPTLHTVLIALMAQDGRGVVEGGWDRMFHLGAAFTAGWPAIRRGLPQSFTDLMTAAPGSAIGLWLGYQLRPLLAPVTLRAEPLPAIAKAGIAAGIAAAVALALQRRRLRPRR